MKIPPREVRAPLLKIAGQTQTNRQLICFTSFRSDLLFMCGGIVDVHNAVSYMPNILKLTMLTFLYCIFVMCLGHLERSW